MYPLYSNNTSKMSLFAPMWKFIPLLPGKVAWDTRPFYSYSSIDSIMTALSEYKSRVHGVIEIKNINDTNEIKLSNIQWLFENTLSAAFGNYTELETQIEKIKKSKSTISAVHTIHLQGLGYFVI